MGTNDPSLTLSYDGAAEGVGASCYWVGDKETGEGRATISESIPNERVRLKLENIKPISSIRECEFVFHQTHNSTRVTLSWIFSEGDFAYLPFFASFIENHIAQQMETSLKELKTAVEAPKP